MDGAADKINQMLYPFHTTERVVVMLPVPSLTEHTVWERHSVLHRVEHMALLDQIEQTVSGSTMGGQIFRPSFGSKPAGRVDCIDLLKRIDKESALLCHDNGLPTRVPMRRRLSSLAGHFGLKNEPTISSWYTTARVLTQHDTPPLSPNVECPACDQRGTLRVRFDPNMAVCVSCHASWSDTATTPEEQFDALAAWVRWASEHLNGPAHILPDGSVCGECAEEREGRTRRRNIRAARARIR